MPTDLLPPNATTLERSLSLAIARAGAVPFDLGALWNPALCPVELLPWLAWALSTDRWDPDWSDADKRVAVAGTIEEQRRKGTRWAVDQVLKSFDDLLELVEWFQATPRLQPSTFELRLPLIDRDGIAGGTRVSAAYARTIVEEVSKAKPVREHLVLVQQLNLATLPGPFMAVQASGYRRIDVAANDGDATQPWSDLLQDENGEPLTDDAGQFIDGSAA
ncbi:phage tail protein I [Sphingomonas sp. PB4P5]|uniref:phage tail protein I n=1 Tax=Parasphingomonas puruogangriensis TaxID=3096155 RepID=UPI002FC90FDC